MRGKDIIINLSLIHICKCQRVKLKLRTRFICSITGLMYFHKSSFFIIRAVKTNYRIAITWQYCGDLSMPLKVQPFLDRTEGCVYLYILCRKLYSCIKVDIDQLVSSLTLFIFSLWLDLSVGKLVNDKKVILTENLSSLTSASAKSSL